MLKFRQGYGNGDRMCLTVDQGQEKTVYVIVWTDNLGKLEYKIIKIWGYRRMTRM